MSNSTEPEFEESRRARKEWLKHSYNVTATKMIWWHRCAELMHSPQEEAACALCGYREGRFKWAEVVEWVRGAGVKVIDSGERFVRIYVEEPDRFKPPERERLYHLISDLRRPEVQKPPMREGNT